MIFSNIIYHNQINKSTITAKYKISGKNKSDNHFDGGYHKLIKTCHGKSECIQSWKYFKEFDIENDIDELEVEISEPFTVTFCDQASPCDKFGCCEYKMVVEGKEFEGEFDKLRVIKPDLSAIVQGEIEDYK